MPHVLFYLDGFVPRHDGFCSIAERFNHQTALRIAKELNLIREYVRGDIDVIRDIGRAYDLYDALFPEPEKN